MHVYLAMALGVMSGWFILWIGMSRMEYPDRHLPTIGGIICIYGMLAAIVGLALCTHTCGYKALLYVGLVLCAAVGLCVYGMGGVVS